MTTPHDHDRAKGQTITWAALLGKWTDFARSAVALPDDGEGGRLKRAVANIIGLQAITQALAEIDALDPEERALGLDRAEMGIREHAAAIHAIYAREPMPAALTELVDDARLALAAASGGGLEWTVADDRLICPHPAELIEALLEAGFAGDLFLPTPGVPIFASAPCAFIRRIDGGAIEPEMSEAVGAYLALGGEVGEPSRVSRARQIYRQFDFSRGGPVRDLVVPLDEGLPPGQPLLIPAIAAGEACPVTLPIPGADRQDPLPVEFV